MEDTKLLNDKELRIEFSYTSASGKRKGGIIEDLDTEFLKSEEGHVVQRTNTPESKFRAIFFKGNTYVFLTVSLKFVLHEILCKMLVEMNLFNPTGEFRYIFLL